MWISFARALAILPSGRLGLYTIATDSNNIIKSEDTLIQIAIGLVKKGSTIDTGGTMPDVRVWNAECDYMEGIKLGDGKWVNPGDFEEAKVGSQVPQQMPWALFSANENAVCIAQLAATWVDESGYVWLGDWAKECNREWFYSNIYIQGTDRKTKCQWIDGDGHRDTTGFSVHWPSFTLMEDEWPKTLEDEQKLKNYICNDGPYVSYTDVDPHRIYCDRKMHKPGLEHDDFSNKDQVDWKYDQPKEWRPAPAAGSLVEPLRSGPLHRRGSHRRGEPPQDPSYRNNTHDDWLVVTDDPQHSALDLCAHASSRGPYLVNTVEGSYCHMVDKSLWPLCTVDMTDNCFDHEAQILIQQGLQARGVQYNTVLDWSGTGERGI